MSTDFRDGKPHILADLTASCQKYDMKLGIYLSPADLYQIENKEGLYGNLSKYTKRTIPRAPQTLDLLKIKLLSNLRLTITTLNLKPTFKLLTEYGP